MQQPILDEGPTAVPQRVQDELLQPVNYSVPPSLNTTLRSVDPRLASGKQTEGLRVELGACRFPDFGEPLSPGCSVLKRPRHPRQHAQNPCRVVGIWVPASEASEGPGLPCAGS